MAFLPMNRSDMDQRDWEEIDFLFITGDAYVDHPSFGVAILSRLLERQGYKVGICAQPSVDDKDSLKIMGVPRYGVLISCGVVDSMVNNYTASKKRRSDDRYSPGGKGGLRPDRAIIKYSNMAREQFGDIPIIIGGIESSLRRFAHYDYWAGKVRRSVLQDACADILVYGMGEKAIIEISNLLSKGVNVKRINSVPGTCVLLKPDDMPKAAKAFAQKFAEYDFADKKYTMQQLVKGVLPQDDKYIMLPSYDEVSKNKTAYAASFKVQYEEQVPGESKTLMQRHSQRYLIQNPPQTPLTESEMDGIYSLPYERNYHPSYRDIGGVPSIEEVKFSIVSQRGCFGGCHFCAITYHQGRIVRHRSIKSIEEEAKKITFDPEFKGYIHDVGGPTANFYNPACEKQEKGSYCKNRSCLFPEICPSLKVDHTDYLNVLRKVRSVDKVKKVFIRSGIRFDVVVADRKSPFLNEICKYHISGQLKVAPEHTCDSVLSAMGKPSSAVYNEFKDSYESINKQLGKNQFLVPYLISGHPGCTIDNAIEMAVEIKRNRVLPEQVQDFYPTPGTVSTTMYFTGVNPLTFEPVYVPDEREKQLQRALLQFSDPKNRKLTEIALRKAGRSDLIGYGPDCLLRPPYKKKKKPGESSVEDQENGNDNENNHESKPENTYVRSNITKKNHSSASTNAIASAVTDSRTNAGARSNPKSTKATRNNARRNPLPEHTEKRDKANSADKRAPKSRNNAFDKNSKINSKDSKLFIEKNDKKDYKDSSNYNGKKSAGVSADNKNKKNAGVDKYGKDNTRKRDGGGDSRGPKKTGAGDYGKPRKTAGPGGYTGRR